MATELINARDTCRIKNDAYIAMDACESIVYSPTLHPEYLKEKLNVIKRCVEFMEHFTEVSDDNET